MNTVNEMGQLIVSCDFDVRKQIHTPGSLGNSLLLVKTMEYQTVHIVISHLNEKNEIIQIDAVITDEYQKVLDEYTISTHEDVDTCIELLELLEFDTRRMSTITLELERLSNTDMIDMEHMMNIVTCGGDSYVTPYICNPMASDSFAIDFKLRIDPRFRYTLYVGVDNSTKMDVEIYDDRGKGRIEEDISLKDLGDHLVWAKNRIKDYLKHLPDIVYGNFKPHKG